MLVALCLAEPTFPAAHELNKLESVCLGEPDRVGGV